MRFLPVHAVNDPALIARNHAMTSINGALAIDLYGQVAADTLDGRQHSGIGGHEDFTEGAGLPSTGRSLLCLPSASIVDGRRISRVPARLDPAMLVTTPRHQLDVVVTEQALCAIAHPEFRDALRAEWSQQRRG